MHSLFSDIRYTLRIFRGSPGVFAIAILTLALSIGANTAIFSFVDAVLLKRLPYPHPEQIVRVLEKPPGGDYNGISTLNFLDWKNNNTVFTAMAAQTGGVSTLSTPGEPVQVRGSRVSASYFDIFGIQPALGRTFAADEDQLGKQDVVVLSHRFWQMQFGADKTLVGRSIRLDGKPYTVIGILPGTLALDQKFEDLWTPLAFEPKDMTRDFHWMGSFARLKPGVTLEQARAQMTLIGKRIEKDHPDSNKGWGVAIDRYADKLVDNNLRQSLFVLLAAVGGILLIGCANLANLLLSRAASREREVAIRGALGAGKWRIVRQFLTESLLLSACGGIAGLLLGFLGMWALKTALPPFYLPSESTVGIDWRILLFTAAIVLLAGFLFGMAPALHAARADINASMREGGRGATVGVGRSKLRNFLVIAEVALAFILLSGAGLLMRSFYQLQQVDAGFETTNVVTMNLPMPVDQYPTDTQVSGYFRQVLEHVQSVPGVRDAATTSALPLTGWGWGMPFLIQGDPVVDVANRPGCFWKMVSPSYFRTLGMHLRKGRGLAETDTKGTGLVTVINESMQKKYFKSHDPIGKQILIQQIISGKHELGPELAWQVVGVVADEKVNSLDDSSPGVYVAYMQSPYPGANLVVRGALDPALLTKSIERAIWDLNKNQAVTEIKTLEQIKSESVGGNRLRTVLLLVFASLALILAAIGIYGVISYSVVQRTHEIGVRAALGASRSDLLGLVLRGGATLALIGLGVGLLGAIGLTRLIASLLFGVSPYDPWTLTFVAIVLASVAMLATYIPARRATTVDPMIALRYE